MPDRTRTIRQTRKRLRWISAVYVNHENCRATGANSVWFNESGLVPDQYRLLFALGFCGSFTTLSALVMELHTMLQRNEFFYSFAYLMATMLGRFVCFYIGIVMMRTLMQMANA